MLSIIGLISPFFSFEEIFNEDKSKLLQNIVNFSFVLLFILVLVLILVYLFAVFKNKKVVSKFHNNHELSVMFGNTLQLQDISRYNVIIPVNRCFDTVVDNDLISENTLHGKLLKLLYEQGRFTEQCLDEYIQDELYKRGCEFELLDTKKKSKGNLRRYKEGSIVELTVENVNYFLVGFSKFDSDLHASVSQKEYSDSMSAILEYIDKRSQVFLTYLPLIGGGHLSAYADEQVLLDFMLKLFQLNEEKINCNINIVLPEQARSRVSIL